MSPEQLTNYIKTRLWSGEREVFVVLFLNAQRAVITTMEQPGTITQCAVYVREIVKEALRCNARSVVLAHNHPGAADPSSADRSLTNVIRDACALVDVVVLDHIIVSDGSSFSFAHQGLL